MAGREHGPQCWDAEAAWGCSAWTTRTDCHGIPVLALGTSPRCKERHVQGVTPTPKLQLLMVVALWLPQEPPSTEISSPNEQLCCPKGPLRGDGSGQRAPAPGYSARSSLKIFSAISRARAGSRLPGTPARAPATAAPAKRPRDGAEAGGPGGHPGAPAGGSRGKKGSLRAVPGLFTHGRARLNGRCVLCAEPGPSGRAARGAALGSGRERPREPQPPGLGAREAPGSGSAAPASRANEEPPPGTGEPAGPSTRPPGSGNVRRPRRLQIASTRPGPCLTPPSPPGPLLARARDPSQSRGQRRGMFPSLLEQPQPRRAQFPAAASVGAVAQGRAVPRGSESFSWQPQEISQPKAGAVPGGAAVAVVTEPEHRTRTPPGTQPPAQTPPDHPHLCHSTTALALKGSAPDCQQDPLPLGSHPGPPQGKATPGALQKRPGLLHGSGHRELQVLPRSGLSRGEEVLDLAQKGSADSDSAQKFSSQ